MEKTDVEEKRGRKRRRRKRHKEEGGRGGGIQARHNPTGFLWGCWELSGIVTVTCEFLF